MKRDCDCLRLRQLDSYSYIIVTLYMSYCTPRRRSDRRVRSREEPRRRRCAQHRVKINVSTSTRGVTHCYPPYRMIICTSHPSVTSATRSNRFALCDRVRSRCVYRVKYLLGAGRALWRTRNAFTRQGAKTQGRRRPRPRLFPLFGQAPFKTRRRRFAYKP